MKMSQNWYKSAKIGPKSMKMVQNAAKLPKFGPNLVKIDRKWSKMGEIRFKMDSQWPKID